MSHRKNTAENVPIQSSNITFPIFFFDADFSSTILIQENLKRFPFSSFTTEPSSSVDVIGAIMALWDWVQNKIIWQFINNWHHGALE